MNKPLVILMSSIFPTFSLACTTAESSVVLQEPVPSSVPSPDLKLTILNYSSKLLNSFLQLEASKMKTRQSSILGIIYPSKILQDVDKNVRDSGSAALSDNPSDKAGSGILRLLVERGYLDEQIILDGSLFHDCKRELEFSKNDPEIIFAKNNWHKIEAINGKYQFKDIVLNK